ncbi:hypothetical protein QBC42DRAFT_279417 [Cladorrhinum samala]|uniref:Uncharacterized protein n=1 Tax=Cladorrhinum samala TaxID=585594 RepID=A0AAV9H9A8_9PEZI|nr:hypothetical protein QBC42DRAFT_279417 [Cladorrhinum samala]
MTSHFPFLRLPREMRDKIYKDYLFLDDGYVFDFESNKLRTSDSQPVDLNLMYTCRLVAAEMSGLPLRINTVTFRTAYSEAIRTTLCRFEYLLRRLHQENQEMICRTAGSMSPEMRQKISIQYPEVFPLFDRDLMDRLAGGEHPEEDAISSSAYLLPLLEAPSESRETTKQVALLVATDPELKRCILPPADDPGYRGSPMFRPSWIFDAYSQHASSPSRSVRADTLVALQASPWTIWKENELDRLMISFNEPKPYAPSVAALSLDEEAQFYKDWWDTWGAGAKARASAASVAIRFLQSAPGVRKHLRRVVLDEDHEAAALPECHAKGLIPFCKENKHLRIERRVSLWNNIFLRGYADDGWATTNDIRRDASQRYTDSSAFGQAGGLPAILVSENVAVWLAEASVLCGAGMPRDVFTLTLDGQPIPEQSAQIFREVVQRDAAWQIATEKRFFAKARNIADRFQTLQELNRYGHSPDCYIGKNFPSLLADLTNDVPSSSQGVRLQANFDVGQSWTSYEVDQLSEAHQALEMEQTDIEAWCERWHDRIHHEYEAGSPLPPFSKLLHQNLREISDDVRKLLDKDPERRHQIWDYIDLAIQDRWNVTEV